MNKLTKGSLAAGAGIVLLLGGTGTFMSWNDSAAVDGATVVSGHLDVAAATGTWAVNGVPVTDIGTYPVVPGDTVEYTTDLTVTAEGESLEATLGLTGDSIAAADPAAGADVALAAELDRTASIALATGNTGLLSVTDTDGDGVYTVDAGAESATATMTATVTIQFPFTGEDQNASQDGSVTLADMAVNLTQVV
ncbi:alternate-type signal peptide domain-containing protein [Kocuria sp. M1R5S2]|uniref:alternate-type signal peptide domain-containing protein n=1 Tax=Kocuria rhizosphaerae TaxID=3376285 RepID=UPI0037AEF105